MADRESGAVPWLAFLVGGLLVVVAIVAWFMFAGGPPRTPDKVNVHVDLPKPELPTTPPTPPVTPPTTPSTPSTPTQ
jgi:hypothetical protein